MQTIKQYSKAMTDKTLKYPKFSAKMLIPRPWLIYLASIHFLYVDMRVEFELQLLENAWFRKFCFCILCHSRLADKKWTMEIFYKNAELRLLLPLPSNSLEAWCVQSISVFCWYLIKSYFCLERAEYSVNRRMIVLYNCHLVSMWKLLNRPK